MVHREADAGHAIIIVRGHELHVEHLRAVEQIAPEASILLLLQLDEGLDRRAADAVRRASDGQVVEPHQITARGDGIADAETMLHTEDGVLAGLPHEAGGPHRTAGACEAVQDVDGVPAVHTDPVALGHFHQFIVGGQRRGAQDHLFPTETGDAALDHLADHFGAVQLAQQFLGQAHAAQSRSDQEGDRHGRNGADTNIGDRRAPPLGLRRRVAYGHAAGHRACRCRSSGR